MEIAEGVCGIALPFQDQLSQHTPARAYLPPWQLVRCATISPKSIEAGVFCSGRSRSNRR